MHVGGLIVTHNFIHDVFTDEYLFSMKTYQFYIQFPYYHIFSIYFANEYVILIYLYSINVFNSCFLSKSTSIFQTHTVNVILAQQG